MEKAPNTVTRCAIEDAIVAERYFILGSALGSDLPETVTEALSRCTMCVLVLDNGFVLTGESACADPKKFDAAIGRRVARENAVEKIWPLLGFRLMDQLSQGKVTDHG